MPPSTCLICEKINDCRRAADRQTAQGDDRVLGGSTNHLLRAVMGQSIKMFHAAILSVGKPVIRLSAKVCSFGRRQAWMDVQWFGNFVRWIAFDIALTNRAIGL